MLETENVCGDANVDSATVNNKEVFALLLCEVGLLVGKAITEDYMFYSVPEFYHDY
jgi:hypothetical protein